MTDVFPELVVYDEAGQPETVKYYLLSALLLNELKQEHAEIAALGNRLAALEEVRAPPRRRRAWWQ